MAASLGSYDLGQHSCRLCSGKGALQLVPELVTLMPHLEPLMSSEELWPSVWPCKAPRFPGRGGNRAPQHLSGKG